MKCLDMHTYGIVIGFSSPKHEIRRTDIMFDAKLPIRMAIAVNEPYKSTYVESILV